MSDNNDRELCRKAFWLAILANVGHAVMLAAKLGGVAMAKGLHP